MSLTNRSFTLFPHTVASEEDCRALCILLPAVSVLKIIEPPAVPRWAEYCVVIENALADPELEKKVRLQMKGYKNLAEVVGDGAVKPNNAVMMQQVRRRSGDHR